MQPLVYSRSYLQPQALEAPSLGFEIFKRYIERNVMQRRPFWAEFWRFAFPKVGRVKEGEILCMTAIALCDFEENKTLISPQHFESNYFFVKFVHGVKVLDADGHFAQSFDPTVRLVHGSSFGAG